MLAKKKYLYFVKGLLLMSEKIQKALELFNSGFNCSQARAKFPDRQTEVCPKVIETAVSLLEEMGF